MHVPRQELHMIVMRDRTKYDTLKFGVETIPDKLQRTKTILVIGRRMNKVNRVFLPSAVAFTF